MKGNRKINEIVMITLGRSRKAGRAGFILKSRGACGVVAMRQHIPSDRPPRKGGAAFAERAAWKRRANKSPQGAVAAHVRLYQGWDEEHRPGMGGASGLFTEKK